MKAREFCGSLWLTAEEERQRAWQKAQDALNALTPDEQQKFRGLLMAWYRVVEMSMAELICMIDAAARRDYLDADLCHRADG